MAVLLLLLLAFSRRDPTLRIVPLHSTLLLRFRFRGLRRRVLRSSIAEDDDHDEDDDKGKGNVNGNEMKQPSSRELFLLRLLPPSQPLAPPLVQATAPHPDPAAAPSLNHGSASQKFGINGAGGGGGGGVPFAADCTENITYYNVLSP